MVTFKLLECGTTVLSFFVIAVGMKSLSRHLFDIYKVDVDVFFPHRGLLSLMVHGHSPISH